jgi:hypothetical protein
MEVHGFRRSVTGRISVKLDVVERGLLRSLAEQVIAMVEPDDRPTDPLEAMVGINPNASEPQDPALARLLPQAYLDDDEAAAEFRRFTDHSLREDKANNARMVLADIADDSERIRIAPEHVGGWLKFFSDVRITIGVRIGITDELSAAELADLPEGDPLAGMAHIYDWLTYLQETLVRAVMPH